MSLKRKTNPIKRNLRKEETIVEFICCCISCWLFSVGICLILDSQFEMEIGLFSILWQTFAATALTALLTRRWWIPLVYVGMLVPILLLVVHLSDNFSNVIESGTSFIRWWIDFLPEDSQWYSKQSFYIVHTLINIGVSILFFTVARITRRTWVNTVLCLVFVIVNYILGYTGYDIIAIPFLVVGAFPLLAGEKFQKHKQFIKNNLFGVLGKRWLVIAVSGFVCIVICIGSVFITKNNKTNVRNRFCSDLAADIQTITNAYTMEQRYLEVTLFELGLQGNTTYIGGSLYKIPSKIIATTDLEAPTLLKVTTFDTFNGKKWSNDFEKPYRINGLWEDEENLYLSGKVLNDDFYAGKIKEIAPEREVTVTLEEKGQSFLPALGQITNFKENTASKNPILFDKRGRLLSHFEMPAGFSYTFNSLIYPTDRPIPNAQMKVILEASSTIEDPLYDEDGEFFTHYTELPEEMPKEMVDSLKDLMLDNEDVYESAYKICNFFSIDNGFSYTKVPPHFKKGENIIEKLFKTKRGHCLYYSTAMVVMARAAGIPARLAAGYRTVPSADGKTQVVDASSPYSWVECYIPNLGWLSYDPTPTETPPIIEEVVDPNTPSPDQGESEIPELEKGDMPEEEEPEPEVKKGIPVGLIIGLIAFVLLAICVTLYAVFSPKFYSVEFVRKRFPSTKRQAEYYYQDILRQFKCLGYKPRQGETISELAVRSCEELIYRNEGTIYQGIKVVEALHYGYKAPSYQDIEILAQVCRMLDMEARWKMKPIPYVLKRRIFLPLFSRAVYRYDKF